MLIMVGGSVAVMLMPPTPSGQRIKRIIYVLLIVTVTLFVTVVVGLVFCAQAPL
jgi:hypothetical protein